MRACAHIVGGVTYESARDVEKASVVVKGAGRKVDSRKARKGLVINECEAE